MKTTSGARAIISSGLTRPRNLTVQLTVLHIDDDPNDTALLQAATRKANLNLILKNVEDFEQARAYLGGVDAYADRSAYPMPSLVLLDLKMPRATGFEVLHWIRNHPGVGHIPIVVLSGSELQDDIRRAYVGGANSYLVKPLGFDALVNLVKNIHTVWLTATQQPLRAGSL